MGLRVRNINFSLLSSESSLRFDFGFIDYENNQSTLRETYSFFDLFEVTQRKDVCLDGLDKIKYVEIGNISRSGDIYPVELYFSNRNDFNEAYFKKIDKGNILQANKGDVLISSIRPNLKKLTLIDDESEKYFFTKALIHLKPKITPIIAYHLLRTVSFEFINRVSRIGKGYPTLKVNDLKTIVFDKQLVDKLIKNIDVGKISTLTNGIAEIKEKQLDEWDIINEVLIEELSFDIKDFEKLRDTKIHCSVLNNFGENIDMRFSSKFHHPSHRYMLDFLISKTSKRLKDFVSEPIVLGKSISPKQYEEGTNCYYMSMATIKSWYFDSSDAKEVSNTYEDNNPNKKVAHNDIIIARSGEGSIGKVALISAPDVNAVFSDFTIRVRLSNYNQQFAYYYFRSLFIQHLVEHNKKGLGNNTNIFPSQICEFPMLDFPLKKQKEIVKKIKDKIEEQQKYAVKIKEKRTDIEKIILDTLDI